MGFPTWYEKLKEVIDDLKQMNESYPSRSVSVLITMLEQALAWAWLYIVS